MRYKRREMRTGCDAKIKCMANDGKWKISMAFLKHNHDLNGCLAGSKGRVEVLHTTTVLLTGRIADEVRTVGEQALVSNMDHNDVSRGTRKNCPRPEPEETLNLIDRFKCLARKSMNWQKPQTIITEVSEEIAETVLLVLPETHHCLPPWSILNSFMKYLSLTRCCQRQCIFLYFQEEFELKSKSFIGKYENSWLASLYNMHEKLSRTFTKDVFSVGLLSKQNDEDHDIVGNLSSKTMTQTEIACWCEQAAKKMRREVIREDMLCKKNTVNLVCRSSMEKEAERLFTEMIFEMFPKEFINSLSLSLAIEEIRSA
ncbi:hypothetical protein NL676_030605 [Syzygium grande]|nr:hypothetical protein NL676_030605 [Syzygium grande]